jgi:hypothetical protein
MIDTGDTLPRYDDVRGECAAAIFVMASHRTMRSDYPRSVYLILTFLLIHLHRYLFSSLTSTPTSNAPILIFRQSQNLSNLSISRIIVTNILPQTHLMEHNEVEPQQSTASASTSHASHTSVSASTSTNSDVVDGSVHPTSFRSNGRYQREQSAIWHESECILHRFL